MKTHNLDDMVITGAGAEFALSYRLAEEVQNRMAILMDSDTHVESGLAWFGYSLAETDYMCARASYTAIKHGRTQPVHKNIMRMQKSIAGSLLGHTLASSVYNVFTIKYGMENILSSLLLADNFSVRGLVPDGLNKLRTFPLAILDKKIPDDLIDNTILRGFDIFYGPVYLSCEWQNKQANWQVGFVEYW
ncbi:MAG: hypothetical protein GF313_13120 [Caldithrix sp.]|nr:hypothetical protein [Caldithrix sp.]